MTNPGKSANFCKLKKFQWRTGFVINFPGTFYELSMDIAMHHFLSFCSILSSVQTKRKRTRKFSLMFCRLFFDLFSLFFDLFRFRIRFRSVWADLYAQPFGRWNYIHRSVVNRFMIVFKDLANILQNAYDFEKVKLMEWSKEKVINQ